MASVNITSTPAAVLLDMRYLPVLAHCFLYMHSGGHWRAGSACFRTQGTPQSAYLSWLQVGMFGMSNPESPES